jgi:hypothetical protein
MRDNKLVRQARSRADAKATRVQEELVTIDEQLFRLEEDIRRLKIEWDVYFNGGSKRPPYDTKGRVETLIKRLGDDRTLNYAQRYRYNTLATRYNSLYQLWRRTIQGREEGRDPVAATRQQRRPEDIEPMARVTFTCGDPRKDVSTIKELYKAFLEAKSKCGEGTESMPFPKFHHLIATKTEKLKDRLGCERVRFSIDVQEGRVNFKAKADK